MTGFAPTEIIEYNVPRRFLTGLWIDRERQLNGLILSESFRLKWYPRPPARDPVI
jgi:hypothetical protein